MPGSAQRNRLFPILMMIAGAILILGAGGWYLGLFSGQPANPSVEAPQEDENLSQIARISLGEAKSAYDSSAAVFVDVRDAESYAQYHIPGALSIPLAELGDRTGELDPGDWIITY